MGVAKGGTLFRGTSWELSLGFKQQHIMVAREMKNGIGTWRHQLISNLTSTSKRQKERGRELVEERRKRMVKARREGVQRYSNAAKEH